MDIGLSKRALFTFCAVFCLFAGPGFGAPEPAIEPRGSIVVMDVQPAFLPMAALIGSPSSASITISETMASVTPLDVDCSLGTVSADPGVNISVPPFNGQIPAGGMMAVTATCSGTAAGFANATYTCLDLTVLAPPINDNTFIDCTVTAPPAQLAISGVTDPARPGPGDPFDFVVNVQNMMGGPAGPFSVIMNSADAVDATPVFNTNWICNFGKAFNSLACDYIGPPLGVGPAPELRIPSTAAPMGGVAFSATADLNADPGDTVVSANPAIITSGTAASLSLNVTPPPDPSPIGAMVSYVVTVTNEDRGIPEDGAPARNAGLGSSFESNMSGTEVFQSGTGTGWSCAPIDNGDSTTVNCLYGPDIPVGMSSAPLTITFSAPTSGPVLNSSFDPRANNYTPLLADNVQIITGIVPSIDMSIAKSASVATATVGEPIRYTLDITNNGPSDAFSGAFTVTDTLPPEVAFVGASGIDIADFACMEAGGTVTCDYMGSALPTGSTLQIEIDVTAAAGGNAVNNAAVTVNAPAIDPNPGNDSDSAMVNINPVGPTADLTIAKSASVATAVVGDPISYTLDVTNGGPSNVSNFTVQDNLPAQVTFVAANGTDFLCSESAGVVTCNYNSTFLGVGLTSTITIDVTAAADGMANNTAMVQPDVAAPDPNMGNNSDAAVVAIGAVADLSIAKDASVSSAVVGDMFDFVIDVSNAGPQDADNFSVMDSLPPQVSFAGFSAADFNCNAAGAVVTCTYSGNGLAAGQTSSITLNVNAVTSGNANNTATVTADAMATDPNTTNNSASHTVVIGTPGVDLTIEKSAVAASRVGLNFSYLIRVSNVGNQDATGVRVSDTLPAGVSFRGVVSDDWSCQENGGTVDCSYIPGTLAAGQTSVFRIGVTATEPGNPVNTASVSQLETDTDPSNNSDSASVVITASQTQAADLALSKASLPDSVFVDEMFQYQLLVSNAGPDAATGVVISDTLPAGVQFASASGTGWTCTAIGGDLQCQLADPLASGAAAGVTLTVTAPAQPGSILNQAFVSAAQSDPNPDNNQASAATAVFEMEEMPPTADVGVVKLVDRTSAVQGDVLSYAITVSNSGPISAAGITLSDVIPQGLDLQDVSTPGWSCAVTTADISCDLLQDLGVGQTATIELTGQVLSSSGNIVNQALVTSETDDPNPANNTSVATTAVTGFGAPADLEVQISDSVDPVLTAEPFDYFLTLRNNGPGQARGVRLQGTLPTGVTVVNLTAPDSFDCQIDALQLLCLSPNLLLGGVEQLFTLSLLAPADPGAITFSAEASIVEIGVDNNPGNNLAAEETQVRTTPTEDQFREALMNALSGLDDPVVTENLLPFAALCSNPPPTLIELCRAIADALADGRADEVAEAIRQLVGRQTLTQHTALVEANANQFRNIDARQAFNRGGGGGGQVSLSGLNFRYGNEHLPLSFLQAVGDEDEPRIDPQGLIKPWGFFINGTISGGEKDPTTREIEFDFNTYGLTAGVDYRFSTRLIGGAAIGYADFDSDSPDGSSLKTDGFIYHLFASYYPRDSFYLDGRLSYGKINLDQRRPIKFTVGDFSVDDIASAETDSDQFSGAFSFGLLMNRGGWSFTPRASVSYMDADISGFTETGTDFSLIYDKQNVESLVFSAGISASKVFSLSRGVLTPQFDFSFEHESQNDDSAFNSQIIGAATGSAFFIDADEPDRNYANAGLGLVYVAANGRQAFLSYRQILGLGGFSRWTVNAGFRMEF